MIRSYARCRCRQRSDGYKLETHGASRTQVLCSSTRTQRQALSFHPLPHPQYAADFPLAVTLRSSRSPCPCPLIFGTLPLFTLMASTGSTPRRVLGSVFLAAAVLVVVTAAGARRAGAFSPPRVATLSTSRQIDDAPDTVLPMADLLSKHCDGTPIAGDTGTTDNSTAIWSGNCTLVLAVPGGELTWGRGSRADLEGALTIMLADGTSPPVAPPGGGEVDDDAAEVDWQAGSVVQATSVNVSVWEIDIEAGASIVTTGPRGMTLSAAGGDVDVGEGAVLRAAEGSLSISATSDVDINIGATVVAAGGPVTVTAGEDLDMLPGSSVEGMGDVNLSAGAAATLNGVSLSSGGVLLVAAPTCTAVGSSPSAPTVRVCE